MMKRDDSPEKIAADLLGRGDIHLLHLEGARDCRGQPALRQEPRGGPVAKSREKVPELTHGETRFELTLVVVERDGRGGAEPQGRVETRGDLRRRADLLVRDQAPSSRPMPSRP